MEGIPYIEQFLDGKYHEDVQVLAVEALLLIAEDHTDVRNSILDLLSVSLDSMHEPVRHAVAVGMYPLRGNKNKRYSETEIDQ